MQNKLVFSGHDSFNCRALWLKKGYDFIYKDKVFSSPDAVVDLGIGKNMVNATQFWMKSFGLLNSHNSLSELADFIFREDGVDPYLEDTATLWLLHYQLVTENLSSIYSLVFNEFRKKRIEFNKTQLTHFIKRKCEENNTVFTEKSVQRDIAVFLRSYVRPVRQSKNIEDLYSGLFIDLDLITQLRKFDEEENTWYRIENKVRKDLPEEVILHSILSNTEYEDSITLEQLATGHNSVGNIFALSQNDLINKLNSLASKNKNLTFTDNSGVRVLQLKKKPNKWDVLKNYYEK
ncbi:MAG: DUF4007 family protein [Ignavibacteriaceae bacterium]|nr:DUF4007 family protein [Ignavibacteriaceae bacterium]HRP94301.1 DUF4007 family protein [Ignavibacteriaceae bacterium]HRQ54018.1 DUF4007 family protein [Ignavibacteriaceae bacterium]